MGRVKYGALVTEIRGKVGGTVFQGNAHGFTVKTEPLTKPPIKLRQRSVQAAVLYITSIWRSLAGGGQDSWNSYAATFPQFTKNNPLSALSGYEVFLKRNLIHYIFNQDFISVPTMVAVNNVIYGATIVRSGAALNLTLSITGDPTNLITFLYASNALTDPGYIRPSSLRAIVQLVADTSVQNIAASWVAVYNTLPVAGNIIRIRLRSVGSGQGMVFEPQELTITVT